MQNWTKRSRGTQILKTIMKKDESIYSIFVDDLTQFVFLGSSESSLNQINLRSQKTIKRYTKLKIGILMCFSSLNDLLFVGGNKNRFTLINITERRVLLVKPANASIQYIYSSHFNVFKRENNIIVSMTVAGGEILLL